jgi:zinc transport system substrate-binding protein
VGKPYSSASIFNQGRDFAMFRIMQRFACSLAALALFAAAVPPVHAAPKVVVSVAPVHSLVAGVMAGVGEPRLLVPANASPHAFSLRPSDARALAGADIVFRVGSDLETFLDKPLAALAAGAVMTLADAPGMTEQPVADDGAERHGHGTDEAHARNPHIWLSIGNARRIAKIAAQTLSDRDPQNGPAYRRNLASLTNRLDSLERDLHAMLATARKSPYVVMHDAYSHFEAEFGLRRVAAISLSPERPPGARRLREIRDLLAAEDVRCVFAEPQFPNAIADTVVAGTNARLAELDPLGAGLPVGPELYFKLMENLGRSLAGCLSR